jgi:hypothetical protein
MSGTHGTDAALGELELELPECELCEFATATVYCPECEMFLCDENSCNKDIHRPAGKQGHVPFPAARAVRERNAATTRSSTTTSDSQLQQTSSTVAAGPAADSISTSIAPAAVSSANGTNSNKKICELCESATAVLYCEECDMALCTVNACDQDLHKPALKQGHIRVDISQQSTPLTSDSLSTMSSLSGLSSLSIDSSAKQQQEIVAKPPEKISAAAVSVAAASLPKSSSSASSVLSLSLLSDTTTTPGAPSEKTENRYEASSQPIIKSSSTLSSLSLLSDNDSSSKESASPVPSTPSPTVIISAPITQSIKVDTATQRAEAYSQIVGQKRDNTPSTVPPVRYSALRQATKPASPKPEPKAKQDSKPNPFRRPSHISLQNRFSVSSNTTTSVTSHPSNQTDTNDSGSDSSAPSTPRSTSSDLSSRAENNNDGDKPSSHSTQDSLRGAVPAVSTTPQHRRTGTVTGAATGAATGTVTGAATAFGGSPHSRARPPTLSLVVPTNNSPNPRRMSLSPTGRRPLLSPNRSRSSVVSTASSKQHRRSFSMVPLTGNSAIQRRFSFRPRTPLTRQTPTPTPPPPPTTTPAPGPGPSIAEKQLETKLCDNCEHANADIFCQDCGDYLCHEDDVQLHRPSKMRSHRRTPYGDTIAVKQLPPALTPTASPTRVSSAMPSRPTTPANGLPSQSSQGLKSPAQNAALQARTPRRLSSSPSPLPSPSPSPSPSPLPSPSVSASPSVSPQPSSEPSQRPSSSTKSGSIASTQPLCDLCEEVPAAVFCNECDMQLCKEGGCLRGMHKPKSKQHHTVIPIAETKHSKTSETTSPTPNPTEPQDINSVISQTVASVSKELIAQMSQQQTAMMQGLFQLLKAQQNNNVSATNMPADATSRIMSMTGVLEQQVQNAVASAVCMPPAEAQAARDRENESAAHMENEPLSQQLTRAFVTKISDTVHQSVNRDMKKLADSLQQLGSSTASTPRVNSRSKSRSKSKSRPKSKSRSSSKSRKPLRRSASNSTLSTKSSTKSLSLSRTSSISSLQTSSDVSEKAPASEHKPRKSSKRSMRHVASTPELDTVIPKWKSTKSSSLRVEFVEFQRLRKLQAELDSQKQFVNRVKSHSRCASPSSARHSPSSSRTNKHSTKSGSQNGPQSARSAACHNTRRRHRRKRAWEVAREQEISGTHSNMELESSDYTTSNTMMGNDKSESNVHIVNVPQPITRVTVRQTCQSPHPHRSAKQIHQEEVAFRMSQPRRPSSAQGPRQSSTSSTSNTRMRLRPLSARARTGAKRASLKGHKKRSKSANRTNRSRRKGKRKSANRSRRRPNSAVGMRSSRRSHSPSTVHARSRPSSPSTGIHKYRHELFRALRPLSADAWARASRMQALPLTPIHRDKCSSRPLTPNAQLHKHKSPRRTLGRARSATQLPPRWQNGAHFQANSQSNPTPSPSPPPPRYAFGKVGDSDDLVWVHRSDHLARIDTFSDVNDGSAYDAVSVQSTPKASLHGDDTLSVFGSVATPRSVVDSHIDTNEVLTPKATAQRSAGSGRLAPIVMKRSSSSSSLSALSAMSDSSELSMDALSSFSSLSSLSSMASVNNSGVKVPKIKLPGPPLRSMSSLFRSTKKQRGYVNPSDLAHVFDNMSPAQKRFRWDLARSARPLTPQSMKRSFSFASYQHTSTPSIGKAAESAAAGPGGPSVAWT